MDTLSKGSMYEPIKNMDSYGDDRGFGFAKQPAPPTSHGQKHLQNSKVDSRCLTLIITLANIILFFVSLAMLVYSQRYRNGIETNSGNRLVKLTSTYSPILDKHQIDLLTRTTNGSFWPQNPPSKYRLPPSPEADMAWSRLADTHSIAITESEVRKLGRNPDELWTYPSTYRIPGHPPDYQYKLYMALPNVFHQIHCLNIFRKLAHPQYYGEFWTHTSTFPFQEHIGHCQYLLLQTIMCHSDLEVITFNKVKGTPGPFPDFGVEQKCRDFDSILRWKERNQVNATDEEWKEIMVTPEGIRELESEGRTVPFI